MLVISRAYVIITAAATTPPGAAVTEQSMIGWRNLVTASNIAADTTAAGYPVSNLANPATFLTWRASDTSEQYLTITTGSPDPIDYVGLAAHNLGSAQIPVSIEGYISGIWTELVADVILPDDAPAVFQFVPAVMPQIRIRLQSGDAAARIAVAYCGKLLMMERGVYDNHTPIKYARKVEVSNGRSESGQFLGRIVTGEQVAAPAAFSLLGQDWFRTYMDPFLIAAKEKPFFFVWRAPAYPNEVGYVWLVNDPMPVNAPPSKLISIELQMSGIAV